MQIISLEAENIKKLKAVRIDSDGKPIIDIGGKNEAGKSTVLDTISYCLGGKGEVDTVPIRRGKNKARAAIDLGEPNNLKYRVTRVFTPKNKGGTVEVTSAEGAVYKSPQALLDGFISDLTFSPLDFMTSKDQAGMILRVSQIPFVADELAGIAGLQSTKFIMADNPFDAIKIVSKGIYDQRHNAGQEVTRCENAFTGINIPEGKEDTQPVKVAELFAERQKMEQRKVDNDAERKKVEQFNTRTILKGNMVREANQTLQKLRDAVKTAENQVETAEIEFTKATNDKVVQVEKNTALADPDFTEIDKELTEADSVNVIANDVIRKRNAREALIVVQDEHKRIDDRLTRVKEYREDLLQKTIFPVEGLSFDEAGNVLFEGIPLDQRGTSKQIQVGLDVLAALNPKLRVVLVKDANDFDSDNLEIINRWAVEKKFQVWLERVQDEPGKVAFFIEDGELKE